MTSNRPATHRPLLVGLCALLTLAGIVLFLQMRKSHPQLEADEEVFNTVDALFTALTSRDPTRLDDCEQRLKDYRDEDRLAPAAAKVLDAVIQQAHAGDWEPAARRLYDFMLAQRGD